MKFAAVLTIDSGTVHKRGIERCVYLEADNTDQARHRLETELVALYDCTLEEITFTKLRSEFEDPLWVLDGATSQSGTMAVAWDDDPLILEPWTPNPVNDLVR